MAFDHTGLFTVIGKYIKWINTLDGYIDALETSKDAVFTVLEAEDLEDLYIGLPTLTTSWQSSLNSWISSLISEVGKVLVDRDYVIEQLAINGNSVTTVLNQIYDYMTDNSYSFKPSVVSLGGSDVPKTTFATSSSTYAPYMSQVLVSRWLDGINAPSSLVTAHSRYNQEESQLSKSTTIYARVTSPTDGTTRGSVEIFSRAEITGPYVLQEEEPGVGPSLSDAEIDNLISSNYDFTSFISNTPTGWTVTGGTAGTDWSGTDGTNGFHMKTEGVVVSQKLSNLSKSTGYIAAAYVQSYAADDSDALSGCTVAITDINGDLYTDKNSNNYADSAVDLSAEYTGGPVVGTPTEIVYSDTYKVVYVPFSLQDTDDPDNVYIQISCDQLDDDGGGGDTPELILRKVIVAPVTYYNGLGLLYWVPIVLDEHTVTGATTYAAGTAAENSTGSIAVANNDAGVFQSYFRKAHNVQMPTNDSNTVNDALAT